jgi:hypothetical protein
VIRSRRLNEQNAIVAVAKPIRIRTP